MGFANLKNHQSESRQIMAQLRLGFTRTKSGFQKDIICTWQSLWVSAFLGIFGGKIIGFLRGGVQGEGVTGEP